MVGLQGANAESSLRSRGKLTSFGQVSFVSTVQISLVQVLPKVDLCRLASCQKKIHNYLAHGLQRICTLGTPLALGEHAHCAHLIMQLKRSEQIDAAFGEAVGQLEESMVSFMMCWRNVERVEAILRAMDADCMQVLPIDNPPKSSYCFAGSPEHIAEMNAAIAPTLDAGMGTEDGNIAEPPKASPLYLVFESPEHLELLRKTHEMELELVDGKGVSFWLRQIESFKTASQLNHSTLCDPSVLGRPLASYIVPDTAWQRKSELAHAMLATRVNCKAFCGRGFPNADMVEEACRRARIANCLWSIWQPTSEHIGFCAVVVQEEEIDDYPWVLKCVAGQKQYVASSEHEEDLYAREDKCLYKRLPGEHNADHCELHCSTRGWLRYILVHHRLQVSPEERDDRYPELYEVPHKMDLLAKPMIPTILGEWEPKSIIQGTLRVRPATVAEATRLLRHASDLQVGSVLPSESSMGYQAADVLCQTSPRTQSEIDAVLALVEHGASDSILPAPNADESQSEQPAVIPPQEASQIADELWASGVERSISSSGSLASTPRPRLRLLTFSRLSAAADKAILSSPLSRSLEDARVEVQPDWANGAKVLARDADQSMLDIRLDGRHVVFHPKDEEELRAVLASVPYNHRPRQKPGVSTEVVGIASCFDVSPCASSSSSMPNSIDVSMDNAELLLYDMEGIPVRGTFIDFPPERVDTRKTQSA